MSTPNTQNPNPSQPDDQLPDPTQTLLLQMQAQLEAQAKQIETLTASQAAATPTKPTSVDKGGVKVKQKRLVMNDGKILEEHDVQEQYYPADVFERMMREDEDGKTAFGHMGYAAPEILEDTRPKKKK